MLWRGAWARFTAKRVTSWGGATCTTAADQRRLFGRQFGAITYNFFAYSLHEGDAQPNGNLYGHCLCSGDAHGLDLQRSGRPVGAVRPARKPPTSACFLGANLGDISYNFFAYSLDEGDAQPNGNL